MDEKQRQGLIARLRANDKRLQSQVESFGESLRFFLRNNLGDVLRRLEERKVSAQEAAAMLGSLETQLETLGLGDQIARLDTLYLDELDSISQELKIVGGADVAFSSADADSIQALVEFDTDVIANKVNQYVGDLKPVMMRSIIGGERVNVRELLETDDDTLIRQVQTEVDTAILAFSRTVTMTKAEELGLDNFEYAGPDDKITRDFCRQVLHGELEGFERESPEYTSEEISQMDNGQGLPVFQYGGGYNCRHRWLPFRP